MSDEKAVEQPPLEVVQQAEVVKVQAELDSIISSIKNALGSKQLDTTNILQITVQTMSTTAKLKQFNGHQKKAVLLDALKSIIDTQEMDADTKNIIGVLLNTVVSTAIDIFYDVRRGAIKFPVPGKGCC